MAAAAAGSVASAAAGAGASGGDDATNAPRLPTAFLRAMSERSAESAGMAGSPASDDESDGDGEDVDAAPVMQTRWLARDANIGRGRDVSVSPDQALPRVVLERDTVVLVTATMGATPSALQLHVVVDGEPVEGAVATAGGGPYSGVALVSAVDLPAGRHSIDVRACASGEGVNFDPRSDWSGFGASFTELPGASYSQTQARALNLAPRPTDMFLRSTTWTTCRDLTDTVDVDGPGSNRGVVLAFYTISATNAVGRAALHGAGFRFHTRLKIILLAAATTGAGGSASGTGTGTGTGTGGSFDDGDDGDGDGDGDDAIYGAYAATSGDTTVCNTGMWAGHLPRGPARFAVEFITTTAVVAEGADVHASLTVIELGACGAAVYTRSMDALASPWSSANTWSSTGLEALPVKIDTTSVAGKAPTPTLAWLSANVATNGAPTHLCTKILLRKSTTQAEALPGSQMIAGNVRFVGSTTIGATVLPPGVHEFVPIYRTPGGFNTRDESATKAVTFTVLTLSGTDAATREPSTLTKDLAGMLGNDATADVVFVVDGERIPAHRAILAARSEVFGAMLFGPMREGDPSRRECPIEDVEAAPFRALLRYLYCDDTGLDDDPDPNHVMALLMVASRFGCERLTRLCSDAVVASLQPGTCVQWLRAASFHRLRRLASSCRQYVATHWTEVCADKEGARELEELSKRQLLRVMKMLKVGA